MNEEESIYPKCKICSKEMKSIKDYVSRNGTFLLTCKSCHLIRERARNVEFINNGRKGWLKNKNLKKRFGITLEQYQKMNELQLGGCAICKQPCKTGRDLTVDHDHKTGEVRNLLCARCNTVLGFVNDDEELLFNLMDYLKKHSPEKLAI